MEQAGRLSSSSAGALAGVHARGAQGVADLAGQVDQGRTGRRERVYLVWLRNTQKQAR